MVDVSVAGTSLETRIDDVALAFAAGTRANVATVAIRIASRFQCPSMFLEYPRTEGSSRCLRWREKRGPMSTMKTVGVVILVIALIIVCFSLIGFVFSLVRILIEAAIIVGVGYLAYLFIRRANRGKSKS
jgi:hypothetical protein